MSWLVVTTNFIRPVTHALILNRLGHHVADRFLEELPASGATTIIQVTADDEEKALALIARYHDKDFSLVDATSFVVMERLGVSLAFCFDRNFTQYGLEVLDLNQL